MKTLLILFGTLSITFSFNGYNRFPQRTVMFGGYYGPPDRSYNPQGDRRSFEPPPVDETTEKRSYPHFEDEIEVEANAQTPKPKKIPTRKPSIDKEEEDDVSSWPFGGSGGSNVFFPIMLGSSGYGRRGNSGSNGENAYPGSATAIANSFSTGKGGVATSHATSYGDPYLSSLLRNGNFNRKDVRPFSDN